MKKPKLLFFAFLFLTTTAYTQTVEFGPIVFSGISSNREETFMFDQSWLCFGGGLDLRVKVTKKAYISCELLYDRKGYRHEITLTDPWGQPTGSYYPKTHRQYFSLPLFMNFRFGERTKFILNAGTYFNYLFRESYRSPYYNPSPKYLYVKHENRFDSGLLLGIGFMTVLSPKMIFQFEFRNCIGLKDVSEASVSTPLYLNSHYLFFGLNFRLGKKD